jgi:hypothetical protein
MAPRVALSGGVMGAAGVSADAVLAAILEAQRAQAEQIALIRANLARLVTTEDFTAVLKAIQGARQVQLRHSVLIRAELRRMVTSDEFNTAMVALGETLTGLEELLEERWKRLTAQLDAIIERLDGTVSG